MSGENNLEGQQTLDSLLPKSQPQQLERRTSQNQKWYTVKPGTVYRLSPEGSESGSPFGGSISEQTKIQAVGRRTVRDGIVSIYAVFQQDGKEISGWFSLNDIKSKNNK